MIWYQPTPSNIDTRRMLHCVRCNSYVPQDLRLAHDQFHEQSARERIQTMGNATWCDPGNHAFKDGTPGSQSFAGTNVDKNGNIVHVSMNACPEHSFQTSFPSRKEVTEGPSYGSPMK